ncbi:MAG: thiamine pyrophosphate-dependent dehydrogenase E1 component subunit alpha [Dehalococcoidia bacterium]|nr:thiamine pyrophosphate-dependent dehydrogenase E1 component subunit alpha [Dehalococcoidia bacterium]
MLLIRKFDEAAVELAARREIVGAVHAYIGEEAVAVGACAALNDDDYITGNHRSHGHPIAKGASVDRAMAELFGKRTGYCKGKGGSMHLADFSVGILGEAGILGSALPVAVGAALASKLRKETKVSMPFFGDGASNEGACHESMNLAAIWKLPVVFVCENNQYAIVKNVRDLVAVQHIADRAAAYDMPGVTVDGQDVLAVYEAVGAAVARARAGQGPSLVECVTYRYFDHAEGMGRLLTEPYRDADEVEKWRQRDPIAIHRAWLLDGGYATAEELDAIEKDAAAAIEAALEFARTSPEPDPSELFDGLYTNPIAADRY